MGRVHPGAQKNPVEGDRSGRTSQRGGQSRRHREGMLGSQWCQEMDLIRVVWEIEG